MLLTSTEVAFAASKCGLGWRLRFEPQDGFWARVNKHGSGSHLTTVWLTERHFECVARSVTGKRISLSVEARNGECEVKLRNAESQIVRGDAAHDLAFHVAALASQRIEQELEKVSQKPKAPVIP